MSAVVRGFDEKTAEYGMPLFQVWHADGKDWSSSFDRGIFIGSIAR